MDNKICKLRAHHGLCISFFRGKGYSEEFTSHMAALVRELKSDPTVQITSCADEICEKCPNNCGGVCSTPEKVDRYDSEVLRLCGFSAGESLPFSEFIKRVQENIILCGKRESVCGDCQWTDICR